MKWCVVTLVLLTGAVSTAAVAGVTLAAVQAKGVVRCGVSEGLPSLSSRDAQGRR